MSRTIFITATDTSAGKSWLTTSLVQALLHQQQRAVALKPVACGFDGHGNNEDVSALLAAQGLEGANAINLYRLAMPAAPALAAAAEGVAIEPARLVAWCREKTADFDVCLLEGVGGLMVPLTDDYLVSDWISDMPKAEVWLVIGCRLGAINHALLTLARLESMGRTPSHIFINAVEPGDNVRLEATQQALLPFVASGCQIHTLAHGQALNGLPD